MKKPFKIPLQSEVERYIKEKKGWPEEFVKYYADRFYNFYMSNGWKVSGKAAMKNWEAAFNSQWQTLKFKEDIEFFNKCKPVEQKKNGSDPTRNYLNDLLIDYRRKYDSIPKERLASCYDYMKTNKLLILTTDQKTTIKEQYSDRIMEGKAACVQITFDKMINEGI